MDFKEILENWSKIKDNMPKEVVTCYNDGIEEWNWLLEEAPEEIDNMEDIAIFVEKVNENLPKNSAPSNSDDDEDWEEDSDEDDEEPEEEEESEDSDEDKPLIDQLLDLDDEVSGKLGVKGGAYIPGTAKYSKATQEKYYKAIAPKISKLIKKKSLDRRMYTMIEMANYHGLNQFLIDNGYYKGKYAQTTAEILAEEKPKPDKPKPTKDKDKDKPKPGKDKDKDKPKNTKPKTPKAPEVDTSKALPHWHRILKTYANWAGNDKDLNYVQKYLLDIQGSCDSKLKRKTPFVEVIQKIHDNILAAYNKAFSNGDKKITIPKTYLNEVTECFKKAKVGKSRTLKMESFNDTTLSGNNDDYLFYCEDVKKKVR